MPIMGSTLIGAGGVILATVLQAAASTGGETPLPDYSATETRAQVQAKAAAFHHRLDSNGDGFVTRAEVAAYANRRNGSDQPPRGDASETLPEAAEQAFAQSDANHDGRYALRNLRDQDVLAFEQAPYDKQLLQHTRVILGKLGGHMVVADFPCSDVCPNYTTRIVHYDVPVGPECAAIGGVEREAMVPHGVAVSQQRFCVPKALGTQIIREGH